MGKEKDYFPMYEMPIMQPLTAMEKTLQFINEVKDDITIGEISFKNGEISINISFKQNKK